MKKLMTIKGTLTAFLSLLLLQFGYAQNSSKNQTPSSIASDITLTALGKHTPLLINEEYNDVLFLTINSKSDSAVLNEISFDLIGNLLNITQLDLYKTRSETFTSNDKIGYKVKLKPNTLFSPNIELKKGNNFFYLVCNFKKNIKIEDKYTFSLKSVTINKEKLPYLDSNKIERRLGFAIRDNGVDNVGAYRIPGLIKSKKGTLIAIYDVRYNNSYDLQEDIDIGYSRSLDSGKTWTKMDIAMDMGEYGGLSHRLNGIGDPAILSDDSSGRLWLCALWVHGFTHNNRAWVATKKGMTPEDGTSNFMMCYSDDDGVTWSEPKNINNQIKDSSWTIFLPGPGKGICMKDGTLVFAAQFQDSTRMPFSTMIYSKDHGETWHVGTGAKSNTTESQIVELPDGSLMLSMRDNRRGGRAIAITKDLGKTWEEHYTSRNALIDPVCMASIISTNIDGKDILFFSNPADTRNRKNISIKASLDNGESWSDRDIVLLDEDYGWGYSCLEMIDKDRIAILYEGSKSSMCFQIVNVKDIINTNLETASNK